MDTWNPWIAETHVKRVRGWEVALWLASSVAILIATIWAITVVLFTIGA